MATAPAVAETTARTGPEKTARREPRLTWWDFAFALALAAFAAALRATRLPAPSLWLDDAFASLVTKADGLDELRLVGLTSPAFALLLKGWLALFGFTELRAQFLPLLFGAVTPPLVYSLLTSKGIHRLAAGTGAFLLTVSVIHIRYSDRVKQFTLDGLVAVGIIAAFWWLLADVRSARRWAGTALAAVAAILLSSPSFILVTVGFAVAWGMLLLRHRARYRVALVPTMLAGAIALAWSLLVLAPAVNPLLRNFWKGYYISTDEGLIQALDDTALAVQRLIERAFPVPAEVAVALVLASALVVLVRRPALGLLLVVPLLSAVVLAAAQLVPLGSGRVDIYLYPALAILFALALHELAAFSRLAAAAVCVAVVALWAVGYSSPDHYPREDIAPLVAQLERRALPSDAIFVYPHASFAFGLYTTWPVDLVRSEAYATGFEVRIQRPSVFVPKIDRRRPATAMSAVQRVARSHKRVWFIVSHTTPSGVHAVEDAFRSLGYSRALLLRRPGARLTLWVKR